MSLDLADSLSALSGPGNGGAMFTCPLHFADGSDGGEATYPVMIKVGEAIIAGSNERFRALDLVPFDEEDESAFVGRYKSKPQLPIDANA